MRIVRTLALLLLISSSSFAQTSNQFLRLQGSPQHGYIEIPADLGETNEMTVEAWVAVQDARGTGCSSIAGNGYLTGWWLGLCGTSMRSYFDGVSSAKTGGIIPATRDVWVHIAAVTDGTTRRHYINGKLVLVAAESTGRLASGKPVRIGSDPDWPYTAAGGIDDLRIWKVARTQEQIGQTMYARYFPAPNDPAFQTLEAWYRFEGNANDSWRTHHGTILGTGIGFERGIALTPPNKSRAAAH